MLILGLYTRWAALANLPIMAGAFFLQCISSTGSSSAVEMGTST